MYVYIISTLGENILYTNYMRCLILTTHFFKDSNITINILLNYFENLNYTIELELIQNIKLSPNVHSRV